MWPTIQMFRLVNPNSRRYGPNGCSFPPRCIKTYAAVDITRTYFCCSKPCIINIQKWFRCIRKRGLQPNASVIPAAKHACLMTVAIAQMRYFSTNISETWSPKNLCSSGTNSRMLMATYRGPRYKARQPRHLMTWQANYRSSSGTHTLRISKLHPTLRRKPEPWKTRPTYVYYRWTSPKILPARGKTKFRVPTSANVKYPSTQ